MPEFPNEFPNTLPSAAMYIFMVHGHEDRPRVTGIQGTPISMPRLDAQYEPVHSWDADPIRTRALSRTDVSIEFGGSMQQRHFGRERSGLLVPAFQNMFRIRRDES